MAQRVSSEIGLNYGWLNVSGNSDSFASQTNLSEGVSLEQFQLNLVDEASAIRELKVRAWGFGDAEPNEGFRLDLKTASAFHIQLNYDGGETFFAVENPDVAYRRENWNINRWMADLFWAGWKHWGIGLRYHRTDRSGSIHQADFGLNELYPVRLRLDETMDDFGLRLESHDLPIYLLFEQSFAQYTRKTRPFVDGDRSINNPEDPDLLSGIESSIEDSVDIPTSRVMVSWSTPKFEGLVSVLYSDADLDSTGGMTRSYAINGGSIGEMSFIDDLVASTQRDMLSGAVRLGFVLSPVLTIRLAGNYRDSSADTALLGRRLLRALNPAGEALDLEASVDDSGFYDFTDSSSRLTLEYRHEGLSLWAGGFTGSRDVSWQRSNESENVDVSRDSDGFLLGVGFGTGPIDVSVEYESGSFEHYIFRTDPEEVDRLSFRLRSKLGAGFSLGAHGRFENSHNPSTIAGLDRNSDAWGLNLAWNSTDHGLGLSFDHNSLTNDTTVILPDQEAVSSRYDLDLSTLSLVGHSKVGITHIRASISRVEDNGSSFPLSAWNASGRLGWDVSDAIRLGLFARYWDYDEDASNIDDFSATRYGVFLHWSSQP